MEALRSLSQKNNYLKYFIWIHGEANNDNSLNYFDKFEILYEEIIKNQKNQPKLIITKTSICKNKRDDVLNEIQKEISIKYSGISDLIDTDSYQIITDMINVTLTRMVLRKFQTT